MERDRLVRAQRSQAGHEVASDGIREAVELRVRVSHTAIEHRRRLRIAQHLFAKERGERAVAGIVGPRGIRRPRPVAGLRGCHQTEVPDSRVGRGQRRLEHRLEALDEALHPLPSEERRGVLEIQLEPVGRLHKVKGEVDFA